jgi:hypothetical protein
MLGIHLVFFEWIHSQFHSTQPYMIYCTYWNVKVETCKKSPLWRDIHVVPKKEFVLFRGRIRGVLGWLRTSRMVVSLTSRPSWFPISPNGVRRCFRAVRMIRRLSASVSFGGRPERGWFSVVPVVKYLFMMLRAVLSLRPKSEAAWAIVCPPMTAPTN